LTDVAAIEMLEQALAQKENEVLALRQALAVLKGDSINAIAIAGLPRTRDFEHFGIVEATGKLLAEIGPADTRNIADKLQDRGIRTRSKNFVATVYATLDNSPQFKRKNGLWELSEERK